jgi:hypothetical protein
MGTKPIELGENYLFLLADSQSPIRIKATVDMFYNFDPKIIEQLPSLYSEPSLIPRFNYRIETGQIVYKSREVFLPNSTSPKTSQWNIQNSGSKPKILKLTRHSRDHYLSAKYLSLRDIVNPNFTVDEILNKIDSLYFSSKDKSSLSQLVKILYSGKPSEEKEIISNLFRHDEKFAEFLSKEIFKIEILPLVHGIFLQDILAPMDERKIKHGLQFCSPPVIKVIQNSVSRNKFQDILKAPSVEPNQAESLVETIESALFQRFSQKIYYKKHQYNAYRFPNKESIDTIEEIETIDSSNFQLASSDDSIDFVAATNSKLFFKTKDWVSTIRFDTILNSREIETHEFYRLPPEIILSIPFFPQARSLVGGGIRKDKTSLEFAFSNVGF